MKKYVISIAIVLVIVSYILLQRSSANNTSLNNNTTTTSPTPNTSGTGSSQSGNSSGSETTNTSNTATTYKDGSYTGTVADAFYGNIQVKAIISGGKITDVQFLQYPNDQGNSIEINTYAMPILTQEAIKAQSSNVNIVSGATDSSAAFIQSLADALTQAKI